MHCDVSEWTLWLGFVSYSHLTPHVPLTTEVTNLKIQLAAEERRADENAAKVKGRIYPIVKV